MMSTATEEKPVVTDGDGATGTPAPAAVTPPEETARVQGLTRTVNELLGAFGVKNKDEALALAAKLKSGGDKPPESVPKPTPATTSDDRPVRPKLSQFIDPEKGYADTDAIAAHEEAEARYEAAVDAWRTKATEQSIAEANADAAIDREVKAMPKTILGGETDNDTDRVSEMVATRAVALAGDKTPTVAQVQQAAKEVKEQLERTAARMLANATREADGARAEDPATRTPGAAAGAPTQKPKSKVPADRDELEDFILGQARASREAPG